MVLKTITLDQGLGVAQQKLSIFQFYFHSNVGFHHKKDVKAPTLLYMCVGICVYCKCYVFLFNINHHALILWTYLGKLLRVKTFGNVGEGGNLRINI